MSRLFGRTLRDAPSDAEVVGHRLLLRAGYVRQLAAGIFTELLPARRTLDRIEAIIREEMDGIGGQEITMPVVHPSRIWEESGRWFDIGAEMGRFTDRTGRDMALAMTHEEVVADLVRSEVQSYRQLPMLVYQLQTKWRDDPRPRAGLVRVREFTMLDSYSLDRDADGMDAQYDAHYDAYHRIFERCGLDVVAVESDTGMMGGSGAHEFMVLTGIGEDTIVICDECGYTANRQVAVFTPPPASAAPGTGGTAAGTSGTAAGTGGTAAGTSGTAAGAGGTAAGAGGTAPGASGTAVGDGTRGSGEDAPIQVATPNVRTIADLASFLEIPEALTCKAVFFAAPAERLILALVRGDLEVNETKLAHAAGVSEIVPAEDSLIRRAGAVPGYASAVGLRTDGVKGDMGVELTIVADRTVAEAEALVAGANLEGYHLLSTRCGRDYMPDVIADIVSARAGDACARCGSALRTERGVEVGNIFKLGTRYSEAFGCTYVGADGASRSVYMGSYGIGVGRVMACIAETHHDEAGLVWPPSIAPFDVHLVGLGGAEAMAEEVYRELLDAGITCLFDDRDERPGVKFNDADLMGMPLRLTVSPRSLEAGGVEMKPRTASQSEIVAVSELVETVISSVTTENHRFPQLRATRAQ